jgi:hypothetical protein
MSAPIYIVIPEAGNLGATQYVLPQEIRRIVQHEEICSVMFHENGKIFKINTLLTASEIHERLQEIFEMSMYPFMSDLLGDDGGDSSERQGYE